MQTARSVLERHRPTPTIIASQIETTLAKVCYDTDLNLLKSINHMLSLFNICETLPVSTTLWPLIKGFDYLVDHGLIFDGSCNSACSWTKADNDVLAVKS